MAKLNAKRDVVRYGIGQWFGRPIEGLSVQKRQSLAVDAMLDRPTLGCPFSFGQGRTCHKPGGVCAIQGVTRAGDTPVGLQTITCPTRFLEGHVALRAVAAFVLGASSACVLKEVSFMKSTNANTNGLGSGRMDWVLQDASNDENYCGVEFQSMYFSGAKMESDFVEYAAGGAYPLFPSKSRRPDYRSSGPKRLAPQLKIKEPLLRAWGKSMAVVVDAYFLSCLDSTFLAGLPHEDSPRLEPHHLALIVVGFDAQGALEVRRRLSVETPAFLQALDASDVMDREAFERSRRAALANPGRSFQLF